MNKTPPPATETGTAGTVWFEGCAEVPALVTREWNGYAVATVAAADVPKLFEGTGSSVKRKGSRLVIGDPDTGDREFQINRGRVSLGDGWALLWEALPQPAPAHAKLLAAGGQERAAVEALLPAGVRLLDAERSGAPVFAAVSSKAAQNTKEVGGLKCWQWWTSLANAEASLRRTADRKRQGGAQ